jgi:hypothetical protein
MNIVATGETLIVRRQVRSLAGPSSWERGLDYRSLSASCTFGQQTQDRLSEIVAQKTLRPLVECQA